MPKGKGETYIQHVSTGVKVSGAKPPKMQRRGEPKKHNPGGRGY